MYYMYNKKGGLLNVHVHNRGEELAEEQLMWKEPSGFL